MADLSVTVGFAARVLARNLVLTVVIELAVAALIGIPLREGGSAGRLVLINVLTNVPVSLTVLLFTAFLLPRFAGAGESGQIILYFAFQLLLEAPVVSVEAGLLERWVKNLPVKALPASLAMNVTSYLVGVIIGLF